MSDLLKCRMVDEAKKNAFTKYFRSFDLMVGKWFIVDELRRFVKYCESL